jgi:hypothetical protein
MWKYAGELRIGDAPTTMKVTGECVTTGQRRSATAVDQLNTPADAAAQRPTAQLTGLRAMRTNSSASYHAVPSEGHRWIRAICGAAKLGALVRVSVRRIKIAIASACPWRDEFELAQALLRNAAA